jgi:hypothetical protein
MSRPAAAPRIGLVVAVLAAATAGGAVVWNRRGPDTRPYYQACIDRLKEEFGAVQGRDLSPGSSELRAEPEVTRQPDGSYEVLGLLEPGGSLHCRVRKAGGGYVVVDPYVD